MARNTKGMDYCGPNIFRILSRKMVVIERSYELSIKDDIESYFISTLVIQGSIIWLGGHVDAVH